MATATLTTKGQITLPKAVRQFLHVTVGDRLNFIIDPDGDVHIKPSYVNVSDLKGILKNSARKTVSLEEMEETIQASHQRRSEI